jgi:NAD(P)-dependent dehydrogenase (short-subunit alcohol dehydrogenase family)
VGVEEEAGAGEGQLRFDGRVALVTGAGRGLGRAHALLLAERGAKVVVNDVGADASGRGSDPGPARIVASEITARGGVAVANWATVATTSGAESMVTLALEHFGRIDIVVNNAGTALPSSFPETSLEELNDLLAVHLGGCYSVVRAAWPHLVEQRYGRVVMTVSAGIFGVPNMITYGAAKAGIWGLARGLAVRGADLGIRVNAVAPHAFTMRDMKQLDLDLPHMAAYREESYRALLAPEHASPVVVWLAHDSCQTTGEMYYSGGGLVTRLFLAGTPGYSEPALTPEAVRDHWGQINDEHDYHVPKSMAEYVDIREPLRSRGR